MTLRISLPKFQCRVDHGDDLVDKVERSGEDIQLMSGGNGEGLRLQQRLNVLMYLISAVDLIVLLFQNLIKNSSLAFGKGPLRYEVLKLVWSWSGPIKWPKLLTCGYVRQKGVRKKSGIRKAYFTDLHITPAHR